VRTVYWSSLFLVAALLATSALPVVLPVRWRPDPFAILLVFASLHARREDLVRASWVIGLARDLAAGGPVGYGALLYLVAGAAISAVRGTLNVRHPLVSAIMACCVVGFTEAVPAVPAGLGMPLPAVREAFRGVAAVATVTALVTPPILWALDRLSRWLGFGRRPAFQGG